MVFIFTIIAKTVGTSALLLMAICWQESHHKQLINNTDKNGPSYGICQIKLNTAKSIVPSITKKELMQNEMNIYIAAKYIKKHLDIYKDEKKAISRYNGGFKNGRIINSKYVNSVLNHKRSKPWMQDFKKGQSVVILKLIDQRVDDYAIIVEKSKLHEGRWKVQWEHLNLHIEDERIVNEDIYLKEEREKYNNLFRKE